MLATKQSKTLSVRLPESQVRKIKSLAASRGVSVQEAVYQALEYWSSEIQHRTPEPLDALQGSLAGADTDSLRRSEREAELSDEQRWS